MEINSDRRSDGVRMPAHELVGSVADSAVPLEIKLRRLHHRRRRAAIRRIMKIAIWSAGAVGLAAFVLALGNAAPQ